MSDFPRVPKDLLEALDEMFPERCPDPEWTDREIWMRTGKRCVVRFLQRIFDEQNENVLGDQINVL